CATPRTDGALSWHGRAAAATDEAAYSQAKAAPGAKPDPNSGLEEGVFHLIPGLGADLLGSSGPQLQHPVGRPARRNRRLGIGRRMAGDGDDPALGVDVDDVQRAGRVAHPEALLARLR